MSPAARAQLEAAANRALDRVAAAIVFDARVYVPVETGQLLDSIEALPAEGLRVVVVADEEHAEHVELGTSDTPAQPFLAPALYTTRAVI